MFLQLKASHTVETWPLRYYVAVGHGPVRQELTKRKIMVKATSMLTSVSLAKLTMVQWQW